MTYPSTYKRNLITTLDAGSLLVVWEEEHCPSKVVPVFDYVTCAAIIDADSGNLLGVVRVDRETDTPTELIGALTGYRVVLETVLSQG